MNRRGTVSVLIDLRRYGSTRQWRPFFAFHLLKIVSCVGCLQKTMEYFSPKSVFNQILIFATILLIVVSPALSQQVESNNPVVVQPGAPGKPSRVLPANTTAKLPPLSNKDIEFMQGMIMHHAQAVEMTAMIESRTRNSAIRKLGAKISQSQADEIAFMKRWLTTRGEKTEMPAMAMKDMEGMDGMDDMEDMEDHVHHHHHHSLMPGMLTEEQMEELRISTGAKFDRLFLMGMIQHHKGALVMVKELFESAGTGQDAELFNFASDIDTGQRGEIKIMENLLGAKSFEEKR